MVLKVRSDGTGRNTLSKPNRYCVSARLSKANIAGRFSPLSEVCGYLSGSWSIIFFKSAKGLCVVAEALSSP